MRVVSRRSRRRASAPAPLPLFTWAARRAAEACASALAPRLVRLDACRDADGEPRVALLIPGRRAPVAYPSIAAALAAARAMEAR